MFTEDVIDRLVEGFQITVQLVVMAGVFGTIVAIILGLGGLAAWWPVRWVSRALVEFFRGNAALIQLYWGYYALPLIDPSLSFSPMQVGVVVLGLNMGGYGSEIVRGAVRAVPRGQFEAATALNIGGFKRMRYIIFPQAILAMLPPYGNLLIEMLKATALVSLITLGDVTWAAFQLRSTGDLSSTAAFTTLLVVYLCLALVLTGLIRGAERYARRTMGMT